MRLVSSASEQIEEPQITGSFHKSHLLFMAPDSGTTSQEAQFAAFEDQMQQRATYFGAPTDQDSLPISINSKRLDFSSYPLASTRKSDRQDPLREY